MAEEKRVEKRSIKPKEEEDRGPREAKDSRKYYTTLYRLKFYLVQVHTPYRMNLEGPIFLKILKKDFRYFKI
jgi:hypothetical protein